MVHINENRLGAVVKAAREHKGLTQDALAEKVGVGLRHFQAIENEGSYPSYEVLYGLIRELHIPADSIFYPDKPAEDSHAGEIARMLYDCDERSLKIIRATAQAALDSQQE
jgi:transcriptional regulator with XRE-family HTH domain